MRENSLTLDKDTKGVSGTPPIVETIFGKIDDCAVFVPDLTFVAQSVNGRKTPNPNVLIEYGWAQKSLGTPRIVALMNTAYGEPSAESLPFNMRHLLWPLTYNLPDNYAPHERAAVRDGLVAELSNAIRTILQNDQLRTAPPTPKQEPTRSTYSKAVFFERKEQLAAHEPFGGGTPQVMYRDWGTNMFLRVIPSIPVAKITAKRAYEIATNLDLRLEPFEHIRTTGGGRYDRNAYGAISYRDGQDGRINRLTEILKNRELWGLNSEPFDPPNRERNFGVLINGYEASFTRTLGHYIKFAQNSLELQLPLHVIAGFVGITDFKLQAPQGIQFGAGNVYGGRAVEPDIIFECDIDNWDMPPQDILMPFFEQVWDEFGPDRPDVPN